MSNQDDPSWHSIAVIVLAALVFFFFPFGVALLAMTGKQLIWGFDDMPMGAMFAGFLAGGVIGLLAFIFVSVRARRGGLRAPLVITIVGLAFDCAAIPLARYITERVEHPERFSMDLPNRGQRTEAKTLDEKLQITPEAGPAAVAELCH